MCHDAKTSITTFGFVSILSVYLWYRNGPQDRVIGLLLFYVTLMQFVEFILWTNLGETPVNKAVSSIIPILLWSQPIFIAYIMWVFKGGWYTEAYKYIFYSMIALLPAWIYATTSTAKTPYTTVGPAGYLIWPSTTADLSILRFLLNAVYLLTLCFLLVTLKKRSIGIALLAGYGISFIYYQYYYSCNAYSLWCHTVNIIAPIALL